MTPTWKTRGFLLTFCLVAAAASGPAAASDAAPASAAPAVSTSTQARSEEKTGTTPKEIVYPAPPDKPRLRWLRSIRTAYDLKGKTPGFFAKLIAFFTGADPNAAMLHAPYGIWVQGDSAYVSDVELGRVMRMEIGAGTTKSFEGTGDSRLGAPIGVTVDPDGNVYVSDTKDSTVKAFDKDGKSLWKIDFMGAAAGTLKRPTGISWTPLGELLVADTGNRRLVVLSKDGKFVRDLCRNALKDPGALPNPTNLWVDPDGSFLVTDPIMARVHIFSSSGSFVSGFGEPGDSAGFLARPRGVASDSDGNIYVADALFNRVQAFNRKGELEIFFGGPGRDRDRYTLPAGVFVDKNDKVYIVDSRNQRFQVYQYIKYPADEAASKPASAAPEAKP